MTKVSGHTYKVTFRLKSSGAGRASSGSRSADVDTKGGSQSTTCRSRSTDPPVGTTAPDHTGPPRTIPDRDHRAIVRRAAERQSATSPETRWRTAASMTSPTPARPPRLASARPRAGDRSGGPARSSLVASLPAALATAAEPAAGPRPPTGPALQPTVQYEEAVAHADDRTHVRRRRPGHGPVHAAQRRPLDGRWRHAARAARRARCRARPCATPRRRSGRIGGRAADPVVAVGPADLPYLDPATTFVAQPAAAVDPGGAQARGLRLPAVLGAVRQLDPARLGEALDRSPTSASGRRATATSRSATATARRRSAGAAGRARR